MFAAKISTPDQLFIHQLGSALEMENAVIEMLDGLEETAQHEELKQQLEQHSKETRQQIDNIERAFRALGSKPEAQTNPAIEGLEQEGRKLIDRTDELLVDQVVLGAAVETEHHEIAVYEDLIRHARAMGATDVVRLLEQNLAQEKHMLEQVENETDRIVRETARAA